MLVRRAADKAAFTEAQHQSLSSVLLTSRLVILQGQLDAEREAVEEAVQRCRDADEAARGLRQETVHLQVH